MTDNIIAIREKVCRFFEHQIEPKHVHICSNPRNLSNSCGYKKHNFLDCPIVGGLVYKNIKQSPTCLNCADFETCQRKLIIAGDHCDQWICKPRRV